MDIVHKLLFPAPDPPNITINDFPGNLVWYTYYYCYHHYLEEQRKELLLRLDFVLTTSATAYVLFVSFGSMILLPTTAYMCRAIVAFWSTTTIAYHRYY